MFNNNSKINYVSLVLLFIFSISIVRSENNVNRIVVTSSKVESDIHLMTNEKDDNAVDIYNEKKGLQSDFTLRHTLSIAMDSSVQLIFNQDTKDEVQSVTVYLDHKDPNHPNIQLLIDYSDWSPSVKMESYSTVRSLSFNESLIVCGILEQLVGVPIQPCSSDSELPSLLHMGLAPVDLHLPFLDENPNFTGTDFTSKKVRFLQTEMSQKLQDLLVESKFYSRYYKDSERMTTVFTISPRPVLQEFSIKFNRYSKEISFTQVMSVKSVERLSISFVQREGAPVQLKLLNKDSYEIFNMENGDHKLVQPDRDTDDHYITSQDVSYQFQDRSIKKLGFHRDLVTSLVITNHLNNGLHECSLSLLEHLDEVIFIDKYEVDEIQRFGGPQVTIYQLIDLEKPSLSSTQNYVSVVKSNLTLSPNQYQSINISLPVHFRYQNPSLHSPTRQSTISIPKLFLKCKESHNQWLRIYPSYQDPAQQSIQIQLPVGQLSIRHQISFYTLLITVIGSLIVVITIIYRNYNNNNKSQKIKGY
ncbi:phosphatidylinositol glycan [Tieghemostelium lacteum]|uniref:Phosphatidylinositol glycan n=1 Tax=Tieghemostelium lacteum TaxID=361077 RepID=A0A152A1X2_TIELA|nr:phosphatidylinositol glycan [Tieghemostelium lacteum]|eukprot:KYR00199.1 phosphatidylinositol glycan [Tieghemostelium lacteum]